MQKKDYQWRLDKALQLATLYASATDYETQGFNALQDITRNFKDVDFVDCLGGLFGATLKAKQAEEQHDLKAQRTASAAVDYYYWLAVDTIDDATTRQGGNDDF